MLDRLPRLKPAVARTALIGSLALAAVGVPGSTAQASQAPSLEPYTVLPGAVIRTVPVRYVVPVRDYRLTGEFGDTSYYWRSAHTGLDFAAASGTPIRSITAGRVVLSEYDGRYGNKTVVRLEDGTELWYCHQASSLVRAGDGVRAGDLIGYVGSTGNVTGPHLHLEVRTGLEEPIDPARWLRKHGLKL